MERKVLGRGISALFSERELAVETAEKTDKEEKIIFLKPSLISPNPFQPREHFDEQGLEELMQSIKEKGVIQPILVRRKADAYELIAGERRLRAAGLLNLEEIPVIIREVSDEDSLELALIENLQREDLNPIEEARAYQYLIDKFQLTQERIGQILGKARASVTNIIRLLKLPQDVQEEMRKGRLSFAHGRALLEIDDPNHQRKLTLEIISKGLTTSELDNLIKAHKPKSSRQKIKTLSIDPFIAVLEEELQHILATKVRVVKRNKRGHILIEFYSPQDLQRIVDKLKGVR